MVKEWNRILVKNLSVFISLFLLFSIVSCGDKAASGTTSASGERLITIKVTGTSIADMRFSPNNISIKKGEKVKLDAPTGDELPKKGFAVEDAIRDKKIQDQTAIPDTIEDPIKFDGIPSNVYNIILSPSTGNDYIKKSFYNGTGLRISSKSDSTGQSIYETDTFTPGTFTTGNVAFTGVFIHQGGSEAASSGCIIFSKTKNVNGTILTDVAAVQGLNRYLQSTGLVGKGKTQQFVVVNLWEFPFPSPMTNTVAVVVNSETNQPIQEVQTQTITSPNTP
jgi:uncharacterized cupredoxin-like copper-binding protein